MPGPVRFVLLRGRVFAAGVREQGLAPAQVPEAARGQDGTVRSLVPLVALPLLLTGCSGSSSSGTSGGSLPGAAPTSRAPSGDLSADRMRALLLQPSDLPGLAQRRDFASADLSTQATPQLALCHPPETDAPHETANVLAQSGTTGQANVFQVLSAYADAAGAQAAYDRAAAAARSCGTYTGNGVTFTVADLADVPVAGADAALHYRVTTPDVVRGDVRTLLRKGRYTVLISGYGAPPGGVSLLDFQATTAAAAAARLS